MSSVSKWKATLRISKTQPNYYSNRRLSININRNSNYSKIRTVLVLNTLYNSDTDGCNELKTTLEVPLVMKYGLVWDILWVSWGQLPCCVPAPCAPPAFSELLWESAHAVHVPWVLRPAGHQCCTLWMCKFTAFLLDLLMVLSVLSPLAQEIGCTISPFPVYFSCW